MPTAAPPSCGSIDFVLMKKMQFNYPHNYRAWPRPRDIEPARKLLMHHHLADHPFDPLIVEIMF
jgi:hypothetical protein